MPGKDMLATGTDIPAFRRARRSLPPRPYETIGGDFWNPQSAEVVTRLATEGWKRKPYPRVSLKVPIAWDTLCAADRSWTYHLHAWDPIGDILASYQGGRIDDAPVHFALEVVGDWIDQHSSLDTTSEIAWYDMAVGLRIYRLAYLLDVAARLTDVPDQTIEKLLRSLVLHFECLADDSRYASHSNHGLYQAAGQLAAARRFPEVSGAPEAHEQGENRLRETLSHHFTSEGVHKEHSPEYHMMLSKTLRGLAMADLVDGEWLKEAHRWVQAALAWFVLPNQRVAMFGDSGWKRCPEPKPSKLDDETFIFVSSGGAEGAPPDHTVRGFPESGYFVARDRWPEGQADFRRCSYLAQAAAFHSRVHKQADDATFVWYDRGRELIVDGGRFGYKGRTPPGSALARAGFWYSDPHRIYAESTRAHNTVEIDGESYPRVGVSPYGSALRHWGRQGDVAYSEVFVRHKKVRHSRVLLFRPGRWLVVVDWLQGSDDDLHSFVQRFHFAPGLELGLDEAGFPSLSTERMDGRLWMVPLVESSPVAPVRGQTEPSLLGWTSRVMYQVEPVWTAGYEASGVSGHRFATLLTFADERPRVDTSRNKVTGSGQAGRFQWSADGVIEKIRFARGDEGFRVFTEDEA